MTLLLASKSETRRHMLEAAGVAFETVDAPLDEEEAKAGLLAAGFEPRDAAEMLAELKARSARAPARAIVLGADQTLETEEGEMLSKPASRAELADQLRRLSGRTHWLHAAAALVETGVRSWSFVQTVELRMRPLSEAFVDDYIAREYEAVRWNVGGYRIEGLGAQLFEQVKGSHFAVLGLPLLPLLGELRRRKLLAS